MSSFKPQHAAVWFEIPVTDMARAQRFYETVTDMRLQNDDSGPNPMAIFQTEDLQSGVSGHLYPGKPAQGQGNTVHLSVPKPLEAALERVTQSGGKVVSDIISIPPGRFAYCTDPDGNSVGFFAPH